MLVDGSSMVSGCILCRVILLSQSTGLPRILQDSVPDYLRHDVSLTPDQLDVAPSEWTRCGEYLEQGARLNINVRQVFSTPEQRAQAVAASTSTTA